MGRKGDEEKRKIVLFYVFPISPSRLKFCLCCKTSKVNGYMKIVDLDGNSVSRA